MSGLDINNDKTKVVKIGASRDSNIPWQGKFGFKWAETFEILGIHYNMKRFNEITELNILRKMGEIKKLIRIWSSRNLTPYGKVTIIKSLLISKITHMLLSLPSPNVLCIQEINNTFADFLWCGKPPKWRKEILEGEIKHGGLKLHNIVLFDKTLKLSWLRRYLRSTGKWTVVPNDFDLNEAFVFGADYLERTIEATDNKFWKDVIRSTLHLWQTDAVLCQEVIKNTPIWQNPKLKIPTKREWLQKGINTIADLMGPMYQVLPMDQFIDKYGVKTNFLEYNIISIKIKKFLEWKEIILYNEPHPRNSVLNVLLNLSVKGCSRLYSKMKESFDHVLFNISERWSDKTGSDWGTITFSRSFIKHDSYFKDTYLKYIQFRTLHKRFYTNEKLFKMGIKNSELCGMCHKEVDSVEHMLLYCECTKNLWSLVESWINDLGMPEYHITEEKIIVGDLENASAINSIILIAKKVIYNCMKKEQKPCILYVKNDTKKFYFQEKYRFYIKGRKNLFDKQYQLLSNIYDT